MPDVELKPQVYRDERPKGYFDSFHALAPNHASFMDHFFTGAWRTGSS